MKQAKTLYYVTNIETGDEYKTLAVSEEQAINNVHYDLWFNHDIWTEMEGFAAEIAVVRDFRERRNDQRRNQGQDSNDRYSNEVRHSSDSEYVQMSFS